MVTLHSSTFYIGC